MIKFHKIKMSGRDYNEAHRVATPLELFFDLVFVIAIASAASGLHHQLAAHHFLEGIWQYAQVFFYIWWAWMNFTWFASAYDTDDTPFRLTTFLQMFGALVFAIGIQSGKLNFTAGIIGYIIMRVAMVIHWLRAAKESPKYKKANLRYAWGVGLVQVGWTFWYFFPLPYQDKYWVVPVLILAEISVPLIAEGKKLTTSWHPHHIAERYGLLAIIVLGEGLLGAANTIGAFLESERKWWDIALPLGLAASGVVFALWWSYFQTPWANILHHNRNYRTGVVFGYAHYFIFASLAAVGSSLELVADAVKTLYLTDLPPSEHPVSPLLATVALSLSIGIYFTISNIMKYSITRKKRLAILAIINILSIIVIPILSAYIGMGIIYVMFFILFGIILYIFTNQWEYYK